jgi:hypothetical protein
MCEDYEKRKPLGSEEVENVWYTHKRVAQEAMNNDPYTNGGLLDSTNHLGYVIAQPFGVGLAKMILEKEFTYEELQFISRCRLQNISAPDLDRLIALLNKFKKKLMTTNWDAAMGNTAPGYNPSYNGWNNPNLFGGPSIQPLYGCPIPQHVEEEAQKGPNEPDEQSSDEKTPVFFGSVGTPFPERIGKKKDQYKKTVVLSAEGISSNDDSNLFKIASDGPSTGVVINENPVSLTTTDKIDSVDEEKNND